MPIINAARLALAGFAGILSVSPAPAQQVDLKPAAKPRHDKYLLTAEEIAARPGLANAYEAVKLLRPEFLRASRPTGALPGGSAGGGYRPDVLGVPAKQGGTAPLNPSRDEPRAGADAGARDDRGEGGEYASATGGGTRTSAVLYIDDVKQPSVDEMRNVAPGEVYEVRYLTGNQAAGRYGAGHEGGAILLRTNRMGRP